MHSLSPAAKQQILLVGIGSGLFPLTSENGHDHTADMLCLKTANWCVPTLCSGFTSALSSSPSFLEASAGAHPVFLSNLVLPTVRKGQSHGRPEMTS